MKSKRLSPPMDPSHEIYDVVDSDDNILFQATRKEIHRKNLLHRSVHILVFNARGDLYLQKRSLTKDENPGLWDTSAAGHVDSGEDYLSSANRELMEELGIAEPLKPVVKLKAEKNTSWEHVWVYACTTKQTIRINPEEISEGRYWSLEKIRNRLENEPGQFTSTFKIIFDKLKGANLQPPLKKA